MGERWVKVSSRNFQQSEFDETFNKQRYEQKKPIGDVKYQFQTKFIQNIVFETERPNSRQLVKTVPPWAVYYSQNKIKESNLV